MKKASPVELRKALTLVKDLTDAGILFVPIPVINDTDRIELANKLEDQLIKLDKVVNNT